MKSNGYENPFVEDVAAPVGALPSTDRVREISAKEAATKGEHTYDTK